MNQQAMFFERVRRPRKKLTAPGKIADKLTTLADWYRTNKPNVKCIRITADDAHSLRSMWGDKDKKAEVMMAGFNIREKDIHWRGFDLIETA
jgi:hypothetical protein